MFGLNLFPLVEIGLMYLKIKVIYACLIIDFAPVHNGGHKLQTKIL